LLPTDTPAAPIISAGRKGRKPGSGSFDDTDGLRRVLDLLADNRAKSLNEAAGKVANVGPVLGQSIGAYQLRLRRKFRQRYGTDPPARQTWADVRAGLVAN
jgi:hypothetical protein